MADLCAASPIGSTGYADISFADYQRFGDTHFTTGGSTWAVIGDDDGAIDVCALRHRIWAFGFGKAQIHTIGQDIDIDAAAVVRTHAIWCVTADASGIGEGGGTCHGWSACIDGDVIARANRIGRASTSDSLRDDTASPTCP